MKTQILSTLILLFSVSSFGFNFSPQRDAMKVVQKAIKAKDAATPLPNSQSCANFSGTWEGQCQKADGTTEKTKIKVIQSQCVNLKVKSMEPNGDDSIDLGMDLTGTGVTNYSSTGIYTSLNISMAGRWNSDNTIAQLSFIGLVNSPFLTSPKTMKGSSQISLSGDNLIQFGKVEDFEGNDSETYCKYSKVN